MQPHGDVGLGVGVGRHTGNLAITVVLPAHDIVCREGADGPEDIEAAIADRVVAGSRGLHEHQRQHLQQVVLHDIAQCADLVVERAAVLDAEVLGHGDLDRLDILPPPQRLEPGVGEAHIFDVLDGLLAQVVVDAQDLILANDRQQSVIELNGGVEAGAERLLDRHSAPGREVRGTQLLDDGPEEGRRDLKVEERMLRALHMGGQSGVEAGIREVATDVGHALGEAREHGLVDRLPRCLEHCVDRVAGHLPQVGVAHVVGGNPDHRHVEQSTLLQVIQRRQGHLVGQVSGDAEDDQVVRLRSARR